MAGMNSDADDTGTGTRERYHDAIVQALGERIVGGALVAGASVGTEQELCEHFGTSRTVIREAIKILSAKGLLESRPRSGTRVTDHSAWLLLDPQVLAWRLGARNGSERARLDLYELRQSFEPAAAELAAARATPQILQKMKHALLGMALASTAEEKIEHDLAFHTAILAATGNAFYLALGSLISAGLKHVFKAGLERTAKEDEHWIRRHQNVYEAIAGSDGSGAAEQMRNLLREALEVQKLELPRSEG
ncbi:FCD domain-containing protein [Rhizobium lusitanum]|uniref:FCD domain-containing protein n=1 Tax=Rhizobium lusitanum TaxID=293958 RepID=A0A6L9UI91_9HYPH|nr:FadR/GntR family transcriptional regulator [Rhizobium lusitanum]NEI74288.1 FCD domain-containing protein [Rhizobium lusitanum]